MISRLNNPIYKNFSKLKNSFSFRVFRFVSYKGIDYIPIIMPKLSPTAEQSKVEEWLVKEGDKVEPGDSYCTIETDKASLSHDAQEEGYIAKIFKTDDLIPINSLIGIQIENEEDIQTFKNFKISDFSQNNVKNDENLAKKDTINDLKIKTKNPKNNENMTKNDQNLTKIDKIVENFENSTLSFKATPIAKIIAAEKKIDLSEIRGSGLDNVITEKDVLLAAEKLVDKKAVISDVETKGDFVDVPNSAMRITIAKRLLESKQSIPHFNVSVDCKMDNLIKLRKFFNSIENVKISVNDLVIKAAAISLSKIKEVNSSWNDRFIRIYNNVDISVAVSTPTGLITPIVKNASLKGLQEISTEMKILANKAREGKLKPEEYIGGTFTISNLGMMGVSSFSAIINPPQSAILAVSGIREELFFSLSNGEKSIKSRSMMNVNLSCDHRTVDGAKAAEWLKVFQDLIENPKKMLL